VTSPTVNKLELRLEGTNEATCIHMSGVIDERFSAAQLLQNLAPITIIDLEGIKRITSFGVRQWSDAMKSLPASVKHLYLVRCPPCFIDQLNMVLNFGGRAEIITATAIYFCDKCQEERPVRIDVFADRAQIASGQAPAASCPVCKEPLQLEDDPAQYFRFGTSYGAKSIDPAAAKALRQLRIYEVRETGRPPEETKLVHGDVTLFQITGTLDRRFKPRRLASGVEGHVVFDLAEVDGLDPTGAARWKQLLEALTAATSIVLVEVPESLLAHVAGGRFSIDRTMLHSARVRFRCGDCGTEMYLPLKQSEFSPGITRPCRRCGKSSVLTTGATVLEIVFGLAARNRSPITPAVEEVIAKREELLSRARAESGGGRVGGEGSLSRYRVIKPLSQGGMAEILLAVHQGIGGFEKLIALKKIRKEMLERRHVAIELFLNEAKIAANLNHPNIVQIFEVGEHGGDLFIAMEYVHGVDARDIIRAARGKSIKLSLEQILFVGSQVAAGLYHAHTARDLAGKPLNIVHRDVSLSNIVVGFDGQVKLVDFGVATASVVGASPEGLIGKCSYMSPEQIRTQPLDGRSDVFSLGIVLYELIAGKPLFRRATDEATLMAVINDPIPSLADFGAPTFVEQALIRALARQRDQRYADARAFQLTLEDCLIKLGSTVSAHQLSGFMKQLFGERAAVPPTSQRPPGEQDTGSGDSPPRERSDSSESHSYHIEVPWEEAAQGEAEATIIDPNAAPPADLHKPAQPTAPTIAATPISKPPPVGATVPMPLPSSRPPPQLPDSGPVVNLGGSHSLMWPLIVIIVAGLLVAAGLIYTALS
jgi:serine/threonine-protein kinase